MSISRISELIKKSGAFFFATVEDGQARVRPFGFNMIFEDKLYFGVGTQKAAYAEMQKDPYVELCCMPQEGGFLRIRGKAVFDMRPEVQEYMFSVSPFLKDRYNAENGLVHATFYLEDMSAILFSMRGDQERLA